MSSAENAFFQGLSRLVEPKRNGHYPGWLKELRRSAFEWVAERGFPTPKDDAWKYTRLGPILEVPFEPAKPATSHRLSATGIEQLAGDLGGARLVVLNGYFAPELSSLERLPAGVMVTSMAAALANDEELLAPVLSRPFREQPHAFTALSAALAEDGALVRIPANTTIEEPIHIVMVSDTGALPLVSHPRCLVLAGPQSRATIVESYVGILGDVYLTNAVTDIVLEEGAVIEHYKLQNENQTAFHISLLDVRQGRGSRFSSHSLALGASTARHEVRVRLEAEGAEVTLNGLYMPNNEQHLDHPTTIEHAAPHCTSRELYKGIINGHGRGSFDGRIIVRPGAFKTDASQTNKNLLLSESAQVDTRPRLEIFADDVKCTHGAAVGQLDEDAVFYLRSRGVPHGAARDLLTYAFASEMLGLLRLETLRSRVERMVACRLGGVEVAA